MIDMDVSTGSRVSTHTYQGFSWWSIVVITSIIAAVLAYVMVGWFLIGTNKLNAEAEVLKQRSESLDQEIATANVLNGKNVESRASELVISFKQYQKLVDGRQVWSKVLPTLASETLQGVTLSGMSVDDKLNIKIDGSTKGTTVGSDSFTPFGTIARQVVAYRDAEFLGATAAESTKSTSSTPKTKPKLFSNVALTSITNQKTLDTGADVGKFSITLMLNSGVVKLPSTTQSPAKAGQ